MRKRILSLLLVAVMLLSLIPVSTAAETETLDDLWAKISAVETAKLFFKRAAKNDAAAYAELSHEIAALVMQSDLYAEGSCTYDGENAMFFWETKDGEVCGYSPNLRAKMRNGDPDADPEAFSGIETVSYVSRGGSTAAKDVAVFQPYYGIDNSFTTQYKKEGQSIAAATGGTATTYLTTNATVDAIADAMESCAVVMFDSHGDTDYMGENEDYTSRANTSYICLQSGTGLTSADKQAVTGTYGTYYHAYYAGSYGRMNYYCVDGTAIANHMEKPAQNNILWMAICLGMATKGLQEPLRAKGTEVVYGYSQSVSFYGDYIYEEYFWNKMKLGENVATAAAYMKSAAGCNWDPAYADYTLTQAKRDKVAFPIVVSSEDAYPGHGNVDAIQTVNSTWTLLGGSEPEYTITAKSNDESLGTVSVSGNVVYATPLGNAKVAGYTLSPENAATVTAGTNCFVVTEQTADCELTVIFEDRIPAVIHYSVPEGCEKSDDTGYVGEEIELSSPTGTPVNDRYTYLYVGWTDKETAPTAAKPATYVNAYTPTAAETTLYALYRYSLGALGVRYTTILLEKIPTLTASVNDTTLGSVTVSGNAVTVRLEDHVRITGWTLEAPDAGTVTQEGTTFTVENMTQDCHLTISLERYPCATEEFSDTNAAYWYHDAVDYAVLTGLMDGVGEGCFAPDKQLTRAMLVTILYRMSGEAVAESHPFTDVPEGVWYENAVIWAYSNGIVNGTTETTFSPDRFITREQVAVMLYRYAQFLGTDPQPNGDFSGFADADRVSAYAADAMRWAVGEGLISGKGDGILDPLGTATRAQIAQIIYNWKK